MKWELHAHTAESSVCGKIPAEEAVAMHARAGYGGMVITDHFFEDHLRRFSGTASEKARQWLGGYERAKAAGERLGVTVLFGLEARLPGSDRDFLIFGVTPNFVLENPELYLLTEPELHALCRKYNGLMVQAHPFRSASGVADAQVLDGVETFNGNQRHDNGCSRAEAFADAHPCLVRTSGSDFHRPEDIDRGGVIIGTEIRSERELAECLRAGGHELIRI